jgi:hypothetical protein
LIVLKKREINKVVLRQAQDVRFVNTHWFDKLTTSSSQNKSNRGGKVEKKTIEVDVGSKYPKKIAYVIFDGGICVFTAVDASGPSTINCAEDVVRAIARKERKSVEELRFFDLQTHTGYNYKEPGYVLYDELKLSFKGRSLVVDGWKSWECPQEIREVFKEYIE